ncbi:MAG TPA: fibronectin type III domain-containing protein, partial [Bacteroidales bacterium]|nr:fibronectin type III domain-containing protein [Bacteroidales bacterium]
KKDNVTIPGATTSSYIVYNPGTYICIISATGCTAKSDTIIVTSNLPTVSHDTICAAGTASLSVVTAGTYSWYNVLTGGTALASGSTYSPSIASTTTYYVQDASSMSATVGPTTRMTTGSDWGVNANNHLKFTVGSSFTLNSLKVNYGTIYNNNASATITIEILDANGSPFTPAKTFTSNATNVTTAMSNTLIQFNFTNCNIDKAWGTNLRMRVSAHTTNGGLIFNTTGATYPYNSNPAGAVSITGTAGGDNDANDYMYFYDWRISAGSSCARTPVRAVIDPNGNCGDTQAPTTPGTITFSSITQSSFTATWTASTDNVAVTGYEVLLNGTLHSTVATNSISLTGLTCNTAYTVRVRAKDAAGNLSAYNTQASTTTTGVAAPTITNTTPTLCAGGTISLSIPTTTGATYAWTGPSSYTATTAAISRTSATTAMSGTYSATITVNGCTSTASTTSVTMNAIPAAPTVTSPVTYPQNATATPLTATGTGLKWYTTSTGGTGNTTAPTPNTTTVGTQIFYVSQTVNGCESPRSPISVDIVTATISQTISLAQGWNLISFNVVPSNTTIASVFAGVITQVNTVKNSDGFYKPGQDAQLQSLTNITVGAGYLVHMKTAQTLTVSGTAPGSVTVPLKAGWNMMGYPKSANGTTTTVLGATWNSAQIIKNFESFLDKTSGTLTTMKPGEGYYIYMNTASNVTF